MGSRITDVCDPDESQSYQRRGGMVDSISWWLVKLGVAVALPEVNLCTPFHILYG
jgi:Na+/melibiose symporter-like transporter